ncbi:MAG: 50S ribosomal protein L22, partial [Myxococcota bacterium]
MEKRAIARGVRLAPRKARLVADLVRGKKVEEALNIL